MSIVPRARATIRSSAIHHNVQYLKALAPNAKLLAVVKANAYGHHLLELVRSGALELSDGYAVARLTEAAELRQLCKDQKIVLLSGYINQDELIAASELNLSVVIHNEAQLDTLKNSHLTKPIEVWLKFDTGMHRLGLPIAKTCIIKTLAKHPNISNLVIMSHFASADEDDTFTRQQLNLFAEHFDDSPHDKSIANSAGTLKYPSSHYQWIRPGLAMFGIDPHQQDQNFIPAMTLSSTVISLQKVTKGESVGYGQAWTAKRDSLVAVIGIGYGDGYPRAVAEGTPVLIGGQRAPIIGRISMDVMSVDVTDLNKIKMGDDVELWGENLPVTEIASKAGTIPYELLLNLTSRVEITICP